MNIYTFYNKRYSGGEFKDFIAINADSIEEAEEKTATIREIGKHRLWSITKGIELDKFIIATKK